MADTSTENGKSVVWIGAQALSKDLIDMELLVPDPDNVRVHNSRNIKIIASSLLRFGQLKSIVVYPLDDGSGRFKILAGNGTHQAVCEIVGWTHMACAQFDGTPAEAKAFAIQDNRSSELGEWDYQMLSTAFKEIKAIDGEDGVEALGWEKYEYEPLLESNWEPPKPTDMTEGSDAHDEKDIAAPVRVTAVEREKIMDAVHFHRAATESDEEREGASVAKICSQWLDERTAKKEA